MLNTTLKYTCQYKACKNWVDYEPGDNCLLAYAAKGDRNAFSMPEISYLTKVHISGVSRTLARAESKLRQELLQEEIERFELPQEFVLKPNSKVCVCCESLLQEEAYATTEDGEFVWCQEECFNELSYEEVMLELRFGVSAERLVAWGKRKFNYAEDRERALDRMASLFHAEWQAVEAICLKYEKEKPGQVRRVRTLVKKTDRRSLRKLEKLKSTHDSFKRKLIRAEEKSEVDVTNLNFVTLLLEELLR